MRRFQGVNPLEFTFVNAAVKAGYSKTKGRKAFSAYSTIQKCGLEYWERTYPPGERVWQAKIIEVSGFGRAIEGMKPIESAELPPHQNILFQAWFNAAERKAIVWQKAPWVKNIPEQCFGLVDPLC